MNLALDRHVFDALFSVTDPSTTTEMLMTATTEKRRALFNAIGKNVIERPTYMSSLLKILLRKKHKQKSARGTQKLKETERRIQDTIIANIKSAKHKPGSASWWKTINYMLGKRKRCSTALDFDVEEMNQNFANICRNEDYQPPRKAETRGTPPPDVSPHLVYGVLRKTRSTAPGKDGIPAWVFRENAHNPTFPLKHIIDHCLALRKFPAWLKVSKVIPLPKVATPGSLNDLRPIEITPNRSRIMERILIKSFVATNYEKIETRQHGFRVGGSTKNGLIRLQNDCRHFQSGIWLCSDHLLVHFKGIRQSETQSLGWETLWMSTSLPSHKLIRWFSHWSKAIRHYERSRVKNALVRPRSDSGNSEWTTIFQLLHQRSLYRYGIHEAFWFRWWHDHCYCWIPQHWRRKLSKLVFGHWIVPNIQNESQHKQMSRASCAV